MSFYTLKHLFVSILLNNLKSIEKKTTCLSVSVILVALFFFGAGHTMLGERLPNIGGYLKCILWAD